MFFYVYDGDGNIVRSIDISGKKEYTPSKTICIFHAFFERGLEPSMLQASFCITKTPP